MSAATVDRVLNNRAGVHRRTRDRVMTTAIRLGYTTAGAAGLGEPAAPEPAAGIRLDVLLPAGTNVYMDRLEALFRAQALKLGTVSLQVERFVGFDPASLAARMQAAAGQVRGLAVVAQDHPLIRETIRSLAAAGVHVVTLATDVLSVPRIAYVGIDNRQAGRLAGHLLGRFLDARARPQVAMFAGSLSYRGHEEREMGFRHVLREEFPGIEIVRMAEVLDDREKAHAATAELLSEFPGVDAIYCVGAGVAGVARLLQSRAPGRRVMLIAHELTPDARQLLLDGTLDAVIDQNPRVEAREALNILVAAVRGEAYTYIPPRIALIFRENIPDEE